MANHPKRHVGTPNGAQPKHPWSRYKIRRPSKWAGINWMTGEYIPNTLDAWVFNADRRKCGVVLDAAKTAELAIRLRLLDKLLGHVQGEGENSIESSSPPSSK